MKPKSFREQLGNRLYTNSFSLMSASVVASALGFAFWLAVARLSTPEEVGLATSLIAAGTLLSFVSSLGLGYGLIRFIALAGARSHTLINSALTLSIGIAAIIALTFVAGLGIWSPALLVVQQQPFFIAAFVAFAVAFAANQITGMAFVGYRRADLALASSAAFDLAKLLLVPLLVTSLGALGIFAAWSLAAWVSLALALFLLLPMLSPGYRPSPSFQWRQAKDVARFSLANYLGEGLWNAPGWLLPILIVNLSGAQANAFFYVCWALATLLLAIARAVSMSFFAEGSHQENRLVPDLRRSLKLIALLLLPSVTVLILAGDKLLMAFGREYSHGGAQLLSVLALAALPASLNQLYLGVARVQQKLTDILALSGMMAITTLGLGLVLLPSLGILGPGLGWLAGHSLVAVAFAPRLSRALRTERFPLDEAPAPVRASLVE